ncbi:hypothetical protein C8R45DRAFT_939322 [Mycena sanguinolenta]|nr:hypothetical protein C8R45DRAFT_939322 [Mycena sanguinolenta]
MSTCWFINAYILPDGSRWDHWTDTNPEIKLWETLALCAISDDTKPIILGGDTNSRTGSEQVAETDLHRLSSDKHISPRGRRLLANSKNTRLFIANSTNLETSTPGRFTSFHSRGDGCEPGKATVDYALVSKSIIAKVHTLDIAEPDANPDPAKRADWSDHVRITLMLDRSLIEMAAARARAN